MEEVLKSVLVVDSGKDTQLTREKMKDVTYLNFLAVSSCSGLSMCMAFMWFSLMTASGSSKGCMKSVTLQRSVMEVR
jgi:hypothetical protein